MPKPSSTEVVAQRPSALEMFTDRVREQELLHEILQPTSETTENRHYLLTVFYGVGGVGKTTLCRRAHEIAAERNSKEVVLATVDFDNNEWNAQTTFATVAGELVRKFAEKGIQPRLSGALLALYSQKHQDLSVAAGWAMALETLDKGVELAGIPGLGLALKGFHLWRDRAQRAALEKQVRELGLWPEELYGRVNKLDVECKIGRALFEDVREWLTQNTTRHLRLLIDGFERLQSHERKQDAQKHVQDFLGYFAASADRAACGRFRALLFGREKLRWDELYQDEEWNQCWNQHLLAGLAEADARVFLGRYRSWFQSHGHQALADSMQTYEEQILDATDECANGDRMFYPFYLNLAVEMLERSVPRGEKPDLGHTPAELKDRFFRYLDPAELRVLMILGLAEVFDEDLFDWLAQERLIDFPVHSFHTAVRREHSYFQAVERSPGSWRFHRLFEDVLQSSWLASESSRSEGQLVVRHLIEYYTGQLVAVHECKWTEREVDVWRRGMEVIVTQGAERALMMSPDWLRLLRQKPWKNEQHLCVQLKIDLIERVYVATELKHGPSDELTIECLYELACLHFIFGNWRESEQIYRNILTVQIENMEARHPLTISIQSDLGKLLTRKGKFEEGCSMIRSALAARESVLGMDHADTLTTVQHLGSALYLETTDETAKVEGEMLIRRAYEGRLKTFGPQHPETLKSINLISNIMMLKYDSDQAVMCYEQLVTKCESVLGVNHLSTIIIIHNLGVYQLANGDKLKAEINYRQALQAGEKILSSNHPFILTCLNNLGHLLAESGKNNEAESLFRRSVEGNVEIFGLEHHQTAKVMFALGKLLHKTGDLHGAASWLEKTLQARERSLGETHEKTIDTLDTLADVMRDLGQFDDAEVLLRRQLAGREQVLGPEHKDTLWSVNALGNFLVERNCMDEAVSLLRRDLDASERVLGPLDEGTLSTMGHLAYALAKQELWDEAEALLRRQLAGHEQVLGSEHDDTLKSASLLGSLLNEKGDNEAAAAHLRQWIKISADEGIRYDLACYECLLGHLDDARRLLRLEFAENPSIVEHAMTDDDLMAIRSELPFLAKNISL